jgi:hypothetical protein
VRTVYLKMGAEHGLGVTWRAASIKIRVNGDVVFDREINVWLNHRGDVWESAAWNEEG